MKIFGFKKKKKSNFILPKKRPTNAPKRPNVKRPPSFSLYS